MLVAVVHVGVRSRGHRDASPVHVERVELHRLLASSQWHRGYVSRAIGRLELAPRCVREEQIHPELLRHALDARRNIHGVPDHGVLGLRSAE